MSTSRSTSPTPSQPSGSAEAGRYVLGVGAEGFDRLEVSEAAYGRATPALVARLKDTQPPVWPEAPVQMAVVACGSGSQLPGLRKLVGTDGRLFCSDVSQAQIDAAHTHAAELGLSNISFDTLDITQGAGDAQYDVVYARFVLVHLQAPDAALKHMWQMVRPGGLLLSEEHNAEGIAAVPADESVDEAKALLMQMGQKRGVHYDLGDSAEVLFASAGVPVTGTARHNFSYNEGKPKKLFEMSLREGAQQYIDAKLISKDHMRALIDGISRYTDRDDTTMFMGDFVQTWARKPAI